MVTVDLRDPMVNQFNSNMTQEVSGCGQDEDQLLLSLAPAEAWPTPTRCRLPLLSSGGCHPGGTRVIEREGSACCPGPGRSFSFYS